MVMAMLACSYMYTVVTITDSINELSILLDIFHLKLLEDYVYVVKF